MKKALSMESKCTESSSSQSELSQLTETTFSINSLPEELTEEIFIGLGEEELKPCRLVCTLWRDIIDNPNFWKRKCRRQKATFLQPQHVQTLAKNSVTKNMYRSLALICNKKPFDRNLIKNPCGEQNLNYWNIVTDQICEARGRRFTVRDNSPVTEVEHPPAGSDEIIGLFPGSECNKCFATTYFTCIKSQTVDLQKEGLSCEVLDVLNPPIHVSDWYAGRFDCGCYYELDVDLLDITGKPLKSYQFRDRIAQWEGREWHNHSYTFRDYGKGVCYVLFKHSGADTQGWAGYYGVKMTGSSVTVKFDVTDI